MPRQILRRFSLLLLLALVAHWTFAADCFARIGETQAQCVERYGTPVFEGPAEEARMTEVVWKKSNLRIRALFASKDAACGKVFFQQDDSSELSPEEIESLLGENSDSEWVMVCNSGETTQWLTQDFKLRAYYHKTDYVLSIETEGPVEDE